jgi:hypothetical protein
MWLPVPVGVFLAARSHRLARTSDERAAAYVAIAMFIIFMIQAWSDMGTGSWTVVLLLGCAIVASDKLATSTGAWPADVGLFRGHPRVREGSWKRAVADRAT